MPEPVKVVGSERRKANSRAGPPAERHVTTRQFKPYQEPIGTFEPPGLHASSLARLARLKRESLHLSRRQREILRFLLTGRPEKEIAEQMGLSIHTIHAHAKVIHGHFSVSSRAALLALWVISNV